MNHLVLTIQELEQKSEFLNQMISALRKYAEADPTTPSPSEHIPNTPAADCDPPSRPQVSIKELES